VPIPHRAFTDGVWRFAAIMDGHQLCIDVRIKRGYARPFDMKLFVPNLRLTNPAID